MLKMVDEKETKTEVKAEPVEPVEVKDIKDSSGSSSEVSEVSDAVVEQDENKHVVQPVEVESPKPIRPESSFDVEAWKPKTSLGVQVKKGEISDIDKVLDKGFKILESEIVDVLLPQLESELLLIGQSKGKFGGGQRRVFRQTQKKTKEGNKPSFATYAVVGDHHGHVGLGYGKAKETVPAREKAVRRAKLNIMNVRRGCGSWQCNCSEPHSIPFKVYGKCGSVEVFLLPAPKGTGLVTETEIQKILSMAGIEDAWSKTIGKTTSRINLIKATVAALKQLTSMKIQDKHIKELNVVE